MDYGKITETSIDDPIGAGSSYYQPFNAALIISYGRRFGKKLSIGMSVKGAYEEIKGYSANAVAVDMGLLLNLPIKNMKFGLVVKNFGLQTKAFIEEKHSLPLMYDIGLGYSLFSESLKMGINLYNNFDENYSYNFGLEYKLKKILFVRCGYQSKGDQLKTGSDKDNLTGFTVGIGMNYKDYNIDYAFIPFNELGETHRVSIGLQFGKKIEKRK